MPSHSRSVLNVRPLKLNTLTAAISLALAAGAGSVSAQQTGDQEVEEVLVTGSFIRRSEGFIAASPVTTLTAEDITDQGTLNMAQIVQNMTFNAGTGTTNSIQASGASSNSAAFNIRGLGPRATLQLIDGKRTTNGNVQWLMPTIAIQQMDIVTDGAAALYGTDAVAGVVNMVPYKSYDGLKLEHFNEVDSRGDIRDQTTQFMWGTSLGNSVDFVIAGSWRHNGTLKWTDRPKLALAGLTDNSGANPTNWNVPQRDADGNLTGAVRSTPDPACGTDPVTDPTVIGGNKYGTLALGRCWFPFADTRDFVEQKSQGSLYSNLSWEVNDDLALSGQLMWGRWQGHGRQNQANPGTRYRDLSDIRGELPGNPFRAVSSDNRELFAVPRRDQGGDFITDMFGNPLPMRDANGMVMLAQNQFSPLTSDPNGGVPFNEDMAFSSSYLVFGLANTLPSAFGDDTINRKENDTRDYRASFTADFTVPYLEGWEGTTTYMYAANHNNFGNTQAFSFSAVENGINCDVTGAWEDCFNPFAAVDPRYLNSQAKADEIYTRQRIDNWDVLQTFDLIINGTISPNGFELPGGPIGAAFGYQRRDEVDENNPTLDEQRNNRLNSDESLPTKFGRDSDSYFAEFAFPVLPNLELTAAVRDEQFSSGQGDTITKLGVTWAATDWVNLRATWGEAFIAPTLNQLNSPENCGLSNVDDLFTEFSGFITSCKAGNPDLVSETADSYSVGFDLTPIDGLDIHVTYSETDFKDRIVDTTTQDIIRTDYANFLEAYPSFVPTDANPYPSEDLLRQWVADSRSDPRIERDPLDIRTATQINRSDGNASTMLVKAWDMQANYSFTLDDIGLGDMLGNWGNFRLSANATYVDSYKFKENDLAPEREAQGNQNNSFGAVPNVPPWRANLSLNWNMGNHSINTTVRYIDQINFDANEFSFQRFLRPENLWRSTDVIRAWTQTDMFYTYRDLELLGGSASFSLGARNLFDREAQKTGMIAGAVTQLQSVLGRVYYVRVNYDF